MTRVSIKSAARKLEEREEDIEQDTIDAIKSRENKKRYRIQNKSSMRNLPQYANMDDEEFDKLFTKKVVGIEQDRLIEEKIQRMSKDFEENYDMTQMMPNDKIVLRSMIQAMIRLDEYEAVLSKYNKDGLTEGNILMAKTLNTMCTELRAGISKAQDDLKITRKIRKSEKEESTISFLQDVKVKAKKWYFKRHVLILCPKCHQLLFSGRFIYPNYFTNKIALECHRVFPDGTQCQGVVEVSDKTLLAKGGCNLPEYLPESIV